MSFTPSRTVGRWLSALTLVSAASMPLVACDDDGDSDSGGGGAAGGGAGGAGGGGGANLAVGFQPITLPEQHEAVSEFVFLPGDSNEFLLLEKFGRVVHYRLEGDSATALGEFTVEGVHADSDCGLIAAAFDPDWANNQSIYFAHCINAQGSGVYRHTFDGTTYDGVGTRQGTVIEFDDPRAERSWHSVGDIGFDPQGVMWVLSGEKTFPDNSQNPENQLGAVVRIVPDADGGYTPASDNPFLDQMGFDPAIYAYGLRSPWRGLLDAAGRLWVGDVGAEDFEEVNLVPPGGGQNFGWGVCEGPCDEAGLTNPVAHWDRDFEHPYVFDDPDAPPRRVRVVWVGGPDRLGAPDRYDGLMDDTVLFGDMCMGFVRALTVSEGDAITSDRHVGHMQGISQISQGPDGFLYATTYGECVTNADNQGGGLWRLVLR
ncbi:MAG: PQQ-dependent sugar dehydrogenase [Bradymonadia bacterium]